MRKALEFVSLALLAGLFLLTWSALNGAGALPDRIPTHFDISGTPNSWGPARILYIIPVIATGVYLFISLIAAIPFTRVNLPGQTSADDLPFLQEQTRNMIAWFKLEILALFAYLDWTTIQAARNSEFRLSPLMIPVFLAAVFATLAFHIVGMIQGLKSSRPSVRQ